MRVNDFRRVLRDIEECDRVEADFVGPLVSGVRFKPAVDHFDMPQWLKDDCIRAIHNRKQNLIDQLRNAGIDIEA